MVGISDPVSMRRLQSSTPLIAGIWTSAIKQAVSTRRGDARKSAAEEKPSTVYPKDLMSLRMDSRKNRSSSTTETNDAFGIRPRSSHGPAIRVLQQFRRARTVSCTQERPQAMPGPRKPWLSLDANSVSWVPGAAEPMSARLDFGLGRPCNCGRSDLAMNRTATPHLRTETRQGLISVILN